MVARPLLLFTWMLLKEAAVAAANLTSVEYGGLVWKGAPASVPVTPNYGNPRSRKCPANSAQLPLINYKETNDPEVPISWL